MSTIRPTVTVTRTRAAIGTQIREACEILGKELGHGKRLGLPAYVIDGMVLSAGEAADLLLEGGFDAAFGRDRTIVRADLLAKR